MIRRLLGTSHCRWPLPFLQRLSSGCVSIVQVCPKGYERPFLEADPDVKGLRLTTGYASASFADPRFRLPPELYVLTNSLTESPPHLAVLTVNVIPSAARNLGSMPYID